MSKVVNGQPYIYSGVYGLSTKPVDISDKEESVKFYVTQALSRTQSMFKYKNLPDTIPQRSMELYIQTGGSCCIAKHGEEVYAFFGTFGGEPDAYYMPTKYIVANPYLNFSKEFDIHNDCVVVPNDSMYMGLMPIFRRYATLLAENDLTIYMTDINVRIMSLLTGNTDRDIESAKAYLEAIKAGKLGVAMSTPFMEGLKTQPYSDNSGKLLTDLVELQQYYKASMFNDIGLNSNYNMKRETIVSAEIELNADALFPFVDDMLRQRKLAIKEANEMFGLNIEVDLASSWEDLADSREIQDIIEEAEALAAIGGDTQPTGFGDAPMNSNNFDTVQSTEQQEDVQSTEQNEEITDASSQDNEEQGISADNEQTTENNVETEEKDEKSEEIKDILKEALLDVVESRDSESLDEVTEDEVSTEPNDEVVETESEEKEANDDTDEDTERSDT